MPNKRRIILISIVVMVVLLVLFTAMTTGLALKKGICPKVSIGDVNVGGMDYFEAYDALSFRYNTDSMPETVTIVVNDLTATLNVSDLNATYEFDEQIQQAEKLGHTGGIFKRIGELYKGNFGKTKFEVKLSLDEKKVTDTLEEMALSVDVSSKEDTIEYDVDSIVFKRGNTGQKLEVEEGLETVRETLANGDSIAYISPKALSPNEVTVEAVRNLISEQPQDPSSEKVDGQFRVVAAKPGVKLLDSDIKKAIKNADNLDAVRIEAEVQMPSMTTEEYKSKLFADVLGTYTTKYNTGEVSRTSNVHLAAEKISQTILLPGERFSYNDVVGPRDAEHGFKIAKIYAGGQVEDGMGGGICQVSSTLYNTVLLADLKVVERHNHSLSVAYVPLGTDATVSYGTLDFVFENDSKYPIKIESHYGGGVLRIDIVGTDTDPDKKIEITTNYLGSIGYETKIEQDMSLEPGEIIIKNKGSIGASVETFKTVYRNGEKVSTVSLGTSTYVGQTRIEIHGPKATEPPAPTEIPTEVPTDIETDIATDVPQTPVQPQTAAENPEPASAVQ